MEYRLIPPFLHVPETSNFADSWERFCCKLLNLEHKTNEIFVRSPPEQGVDLYYPSRRIAYQCKSVESGKAGDFNVKHAIDSYRAALANQVSIGWASYALCTNVDVTGTALAKLNAAIPALTVLPASYWVQSCEQHPSVVERNFRLVIDVQPRHISYQHDLGDVATTFGDPPRHPDAEFYTILLYSNRHDTIYRLPVRAGMNVGQLVAAVRDLFKLPGQATFAQDQISVSLSHSLVSDGKRVHFDQTLSEAGIGPDAIVTYWTTVTWRDTNDDREFRGNVIHLETMSGLARRRSQQERREAALNAYNAMLANRFAALDQELAVPKG